MKRVGLKQNSSSVYEVAKRLHQGVAILEGEMLPYSKVVYQPLSTLQAVFMSSRLVIEFRR